MLQVIQKSRNSFKHIMFEKFRKDVIKRSLTCVGVLGRPRNKNKCFLAAGPDFVFCTSTLKSFRLLAHFLHLTLGLNIPG